MQSREEKVESVFVADLVLRLGDGDRAKGHGHGHGRPKVVVELLYTYDTWYALLLRTIHLLLGFDIFFHYFCYAIEGKDAKEPNTGNSVEPFYAKQEMQNLFRL